MLEFQRFGWQATIYATIISSFEVPCNQINVPNMLRSSQEMGKNGILSWLKVDPIKPLKSRSHNSNLKYLHHKWEPREWSFFWRLYFFFPNKKSQHPPPIPVGSPQVSTYCNLLHEEGPHSLVRQPHDILQWRGCLSVHSGQSRLGLHLRVKAPGRPFPCPSPVFFFFYPKKVK